LWSQNTVPHGETRLTLLFNHTAASSRESSAVEVVRTIRYFFARFLRGVGAVSPGYSARMIPILGSIVSPPCSTTSISASIAARQERVVLALRQACDEVAGIAQGAQIAAIGQGDGIVEGAVPAFVRHQSLIRFSTRVCLCPNCGAIADIPQPPLTATSGLMHRNNSFDHLVAQRKQCRRNLAPPSSS
jgi:hypothetical protein